MFKNVRKNFVKNLTEAAKAFAVLNGDDFYSYIR